MLNYQLARTNMITQQVRALNVVNENVLHVLELLPIENFVLREYAQLAYCDQALPIGEHQKTLPPSVIGRALQALNLQGTEKVLEIGSGTGLVTACLSRLCKTVACVEIFPSLITKAQKELDRLHCRNVSFECNNGIGGLSNQAPYDVIMVSGAYPCGIPKSLLEQLKPNGRLFAFTGMKPIMEAVLVQKTDNTNIQITKQFETLVDTLIHAPMPSQFKF